jgi:ABC-type hemin transport system substrate-binding protein
LGCDANPDGSSDRNSANSGDGGEPTIVSLTPAITRMLIDMGKQDQLVGVSKEDDASLGLPVCGSYNNPVIARIVELKPDLVLTESPLGEAGDVPPLLRSLADEGLFELKIIPHSRSIADVERALIDAEAGLGAAIGDAQAAERARKLMSLRIQLVGDVLKDAERPRVLMLINPSTLGAIGTGVTHDELLRLAGGTNAMSHINSGYLTLDRAQLQQTVRPDVVLILEPSGSELSDSDPRLRAFEGLAVPVNTTRRFSVIQHPQAMLPSTALPEVMLEMALVLHPDRAAAIREAYDTAELVVQQTKDNAEDGS